VQIVASILAASLYFDALYFCLSGAGKGGMVFLRQA